MDVSTTIRFLQIQSETRAKRWHEGPEAAWSLLEWAGAMCGESGEAANVAKKIKRIDSKMRNIEKFTAPENRNQLLDDAARMARVRYKRELAKEVADVILYGICIFNELGVDAEEILREVFNEKSEEYDFPERI